MLTFANDAEKVRADGPTRISFRKLGIAIPDPRLNRSHLRVLYHIMECLNYQTGTAFPGRQTIANEEELSLKTVENVLYDLKAWGYVVWLRQGAPDLHAGRLLHYTLAAARWTDEEIQVGIVEFVKAQQSKKVPAIAGSLKVPAGTGTSGQKVPAIAGSSEIKVPARPGEKVPAPAGDSNLYKELDKREGARAEKCAPGKSPKTRLPADWTCPPEWRAYAQSKGAAEFQIDFLEDAFRGYWLSGDAAGGGLKVDWKGTWENWVRREVAKGSLPRSAPKVGANGAHPQRPAGMSDAAWEIRLTELATTAGST